MKKKGGGRETQETKDGNRHKGREGGRGGDAE